MAPQEPDERSRSTSRLRPEECCGRLTGALGSSFGNAWSVSLLDNPTCCRLQGPRAAFEVPTADRLLELILPRGKFLPAQKLVGLPTFHPCSAFHRSQTRISVRPEV